MFDNERMMQRWLEEQILSSDEGMHELIDEFTETAEGKQKATSKIINSYKRSLESLRFTELISSDENISITTGNVLRPDFLLFSSESQSVVIVELKNIANPTREAGTELGAYTSEIKHYLPFISDADIVHVIISREWPTLLRRYVFNQIFWMDRNILCLEPYEVSNNQKKLRALPPEKFAEVEVPPLLSSKHLGGYQICLYDYELYKGCSRDRLDICLEPFKAATAAMATKGSMLKNHGFAFLWKDHRPNFAPYSITLINVAPFQSLERYVHSSQKIPKIAKKFIQVAQEIPLEGHCASLDEIADSGMVFLKKFCSPQPEGYLTWDYHKDFLSRQSELIEFHAWGMFNDLLLNRLADIYEAGSINTKLTDPGLGLELIEELLDNDYEFIQLHNVEFDC